MILGTDYPFPLGEVQIVDTWPGKVGGIYEQPKIETNEEGTTVLFQVIAESEFSKKTKKKLLWDNAISFLNLDHTKF